MKKEGVLKTILAAALSLCFLSCVPKESVAAAAELQQPTVAENMEVEISKGECDLPPLKINGGFSYTADLFAYGDEDYKAPIAQGVVSYRFEQT